MPFNFKHTSSASGGEGRDARHGRRRQMVVGLGALSLAAVFALAVPAGAAEAGAAAADPPGNNGTIKIDNVTLNDPTDDAPNNEPHPGCNFEVDFYGFDAGVGDATVTFAVHNPTRGDDVLDVGPKTVPIGEDANDGGGSEAGIDASQAYDLQSALAAGAYEPGPQGYHIKVTVNAPGSIGADTKYKVFWVTDCAPPVVDDEVIEEEKTVIIEDHDDDVVVVNSAEVDVAPAVATPPPAKVKVDVLGVTVSRPEVQAARGELPRTGSAVYPSLMLAAILLMLGTAARRLGRVRTVTQP